MKIHNQIIKTHDSFFKKIEKDTKKVMNFSHNKCDKNVIFKKEIFDFDHVEVAWPRGFLRTFEPEAVE